MVINYTKIIVDNLQNSSYFVRNDDFFSSFFLFYKDNFAKNEVYATIFIQMKVDIIEIQKIIEEKRLIFGQKLQNFFTKSFEKLTSFVAKKTSNLFNSQHFLFFSCASIVLASVLIRSTRDIGHDSAVFIEMAQKILSGGKYYYDFFENNFPLPLYLMTIPVYFSNVFNLNTIFVVDFFVNLIGAVSVYSSYKIMVFAYELNLKGEEKGAKKLLLKAKSILFYLCKKLGFYRNIKARSSYFEGRERLPIHLQFILIAFCFAYFFRIYTMQFNEYATKSSFFLALVFPYIACNFWRINSSKLKIIEGILAGLLICLKPHYALLIAVFELAKIQDRYKKSNIAKIIFSLNNVVAFFVVIFYLFLMATFIKEYFEFLPSFVALYFDYDYSGISRILQGDIFVILLLIILLSDQIKKIDNVKPLLLATFSAQIIVLSEFIGGFDQRFIIFSLAFPLILLMIYQVFKEKKVNFSRDWILVLLLILIPQFDPRSTFNLAFSLCYFWWIILFFRRDFRPVPVILALISVILIYVNSDFAWHFCALASLISLKLNWISKKNNGNDYFTRSRLALILLALSYLLNLIFTSIYNYDNLNGAFLKSPNIMNEKRIELIKKYVKKDEDVLVISDAIYDLQPAFLYAHKQNKLPFHHFLALFQNINDSNESEIFYYKSVKHKEVIDYLFLRLKEQMKNEKNKLIFIKKGGYFKTKCTIGFLEYYFQDEEFRRIFLENYEFLDEIYDLVDVKKLTNFNEQKISEVELKSEKIRSQEFEVYIRK